MHNSFALDELAHRTEDEARRQGAAFPMALALNYRRLSELIADYHLRKVFRKKFGSLLQSLGCVVPEALRERALPA